MGMFISININKSLNNYSVTMREPPQPVLFWRIPSQFETEPNFFLQPCTIRLTYHQALLVSGYTPEMGANLRHVCVITILEHTENGILLLDLSQLKPNSSDIYTLIPSLRASIHDLLHALQTILRFEFRTSVRIFFAPRKLHARQLEVLGAKMVNTAAHGAAYLLRR